jgi:transcriptional regulator with XRE-family HTH domain
MEDLIFTFMDYKKYLRSAIKQAPRAGHGLRQKLAEAMQIQPTYLSQVLNGDRDLSIDQGVLLAEHLLLTPEEAEFLLLLINRGRAASAKSRQFFDRLLEERREEYVTVKNRLKIESELSEEDRATYYSDVVYGAVHMAVTIPSLRSLPLLAARLRVPVERAREVLEFLRGCGLVEQIGNQFVPGKTSLFVDRSSPHVVAHHRNWRLKALENAAARSQDNYHVTFGLTLSAKDAQLIRQRLADVIEEIGETVKASPEEKLMGFCLDFFEY